VSGFKEITISGDASERGLQHGVALSAEIATAIAWYRKIFRLPEPEILARAAHFRTVIENFNPDYATEMEGIAKGSSQDPLWIVALNARTEILSHVSAAQARECTALCFPDHRILGQNWDWAEALEPLVAVMRIERPDGHIIRMMSEPGILGKIGMNSAGLGVCLNILTCGRILDGLPVHIMLRAVLDQPDFDSALQLAKEHAGGKASNLLIADAEGHCADVEFAADSYFVLHPENGRLIHTNHYLGRDINDPDDPQFASSRARMTSASHLAKPTDSDPLTNMQTLLTDRSNKTLPIYRTYEPNEEIEDVGTVCTIVMELNKRMFHIRKGNGDTATFRKYAV